MATVRYDLRKSYEEAEANAIGTEYVRADLLPPLLRQRARAIARLYALRIRFYQTRNGSELQQIDADTAALQSKLWSTVQAPAMAQPTPADGVGRIGHERRVELARLYPGGVVEPHPRFCVELNDRDRGMLQCAGGLRCANSKASLLNFTARSIDSVVADRRHRQPTRRLYPRSPAKPGEPAAIIRQLSNFACSGRCEKKGLPGNRAGRAGARPSPLSTGRWKSRKNRFLMG